MLHHELVDRLAAAATARPTHLTTFGAWAVRADPELPFRRSNSTIPFAGGPAFDLDSRLDEVEAHYRARGLQPRLQIVPASDPADIDARLAERGYQVDAPVDVLVADLVEVGHLADAVGRPARDRPLVRVERGLGAEVLESFDHDPTARARIEGYARLLAGIAPAHLVATARIHDEVAAVGIGVVDRGWLGVFGMQTRRSWRRRGAARAVLGALARQAVVDGATRGYLQVEVDNEPAQALYSSAGFTPSHSYHYRVLDRPVPSRGGVPRPARR